MSARPKAHVMYWTAEMCEMVDSDGPYWEITIDVADGGVATRQHPTNPGVLIQWAHRWASQRGVDLDLTGTIGGAA